MSKDDPVLTVAEWYNLMAALKQIIERYGIAEVEAGLRHLKVIS